jgi:predicted nucleotidyltransferase
LLGEVTGGGGYEQLLAGAQRLRVFDTEIAVVTLPQLIRLKRAAGRAKDLEAIAELEALLDEQGAGF